MMENLRGFANGLDKMHNQETRRYQTASYGTFEKSRRYDLMSRLQKISSEFNSLIASQDSFLR